MTDTFEAVRLVNKYVADVLEGEDVLIGNFTVGLDESENGFPVRHDISGKHSVVSTAKEAVFQAIRYSL